MVLGSTRKKPVCQKCGYPMAGHKRPHGVPVCPRGDSAPASPQTAGPSSRTVPPFDFNPTASGYWERQNPNWVEPVSYAKQTRSYVIPERGSSWVSTERDGGSQGTPSRQQPLRSPAPVHEVIDVDADDEVEEVEHRSTWSQEPEHEDEQYEPSEPAEEGDDSDTSSNRSSATVIKRVTRRLSSVLGRGTPLASLYSSPRSQVPVIRTAAQAEGLYTRVVHLERGPAEAAGFKEELATPVRTFPGREGSWMVAVGRDQGAVNALVESAATPPRPGMRLQPDGMLEPYDYDRGLNRERNERVGSYPEDPRWIRNTFFDILVAGAVGGLVVFYCLSAI
ncbi:hypothetical protein GSI_01121 [Ganoderma sinense ZZ0214-1]|uniref:Uncharacterized protein n=1 Tax=Ganoderma sinense ZZ0214-1 TaxID=1077348 RepID=A0A2G8SUI4_9APHY|nr:hypothetical protein GSI_01121 [Ganoderma sinense ZZ0214-1]